MARLLVGLIIFFMTTALPAAAAKRVALVIGNAEYQFVTPLTNPLNDAALMETALKNAGFEVIRKNNLDQQGMKLALIEFSRKLKQGAEAGMLYYAGHGIEVDGKNYLVPIDSNMQSKEEADVYNFDVNSFLSMMENSGVPFNIMVLDACRNNPFRGLRTTGGGLAPMRAPVGSYVAYATAPGSVAADGDGKNSPFTEALAANMAVPGLALEEVFKQTRTKVRAATGGAQVPFDSSAIEGNFYFTAPDRVIPQPELPLADRNAEAKLAFDTADSDINMLKTVASEFADTTWGKLAAGRVKTLEEIKVALEVSPTQTPEPQFVIKKGKKQIYDRIIEDEEVIGGSELSATITDPPPLPLPPPPVENLKLKFGGRIIRLTGDGGKSELLKETIANASDGDRIELGPGTYRGGFKIDKSVEIVGIGQNKNIIVQSSGSDVFAWVSGVGQINNITISQNGGCSKASPCLAVRVKNSKFVLSNSHTTSLGGGGILIEGRLTDAKVLNNSISGSLGSGLLIGDGAAVLVEGNEISNNKNSGIEVAYEANPFVKGNRIHHNGEHGVYAYASAKGHFVENKIYNNKYNAVTTDEKATPFFTKNDLTENGSYAVWITNGGGGTFLENDFRRNKQGALSAEPNAAKYYSEKNKH